LHICLAIESIENSIESHRDWRYNARIMSLSPGTKLGPYEIEAPLGAGGMGEVYRARDTRLDRTVAIKVLPDQLSCNANSRQRFEREARAISSLNHPHICALYDVGSQDGIDFLVMEYLEGQTLADRLQKGALPIEQVLKIGTEIADALDKAHRQGIVHRDLKPGNIILTTSGPKLMDFGLAKPAQAELVSSASAGPTLSKSLTVEGTIVGTFQYMSPEQLEGRDSDARSDLFSLGAVLYEMSTGKPAFNGKTAASMIAAILASEPIPITTLKPASPPDLDRLIRTVLAKNPDERWQSARDIGIALAGIAAGDKRRPSEYPNLWRIVAGLLAVVALTLGVVLIFHRTNANPVLLRLAIPPPSNTRFSALERLLAISPDGRQVAFAAVDRNGQSSLWVRPLDSLEARTLPGTEDADSPFWSPDSKLIGFYSHSKLKKIDPSGGQPEIICDAGADPGGATWNRDGVIVFAPNFEGVLYRVPASGGQPIPVTEAYTAHNETNHLHPEFLPDGRHFLFLVAGRDDGGIHVGSLDSTEHHLVLHESSVAVYAEPGYLLFGRNGVLMAQRFDAKAIETLGEPIRIVGNVESVAGGGYSFSVSRNGVLVYWTGPRFNPTQLVWYRRDGTRLGMLGPVGPFRLPRISPDRRTVAVDRLDSANDISVWLIDARGVPTRFAFGDFDLSPIWAPDSSSVIFASPRDGLPPNLFQKTLVGGSEEHRLMHSAINSIATDWSRDGRYVVYMANELGTNWNIWVMPLSGDQAPRPVLRTQFNEMSGRISPDGRWLAYVSDESGKWEVYVQRFLSSGGKWQISDMGGNQPQWSPDGTELFYVASDQKLMAVPVHTGLSLDPGTPKPLFQLHAPTDFFGFASFASYDVDSGGQRFLVSTLVAEEASPPLDVVINWTAALGTQ
jgi:serine/threonine protein kinase